jgi:DNA-binding response OmpR family regulator
MPRMDGLEFIRYIRSSERYARTKIIITTALSENDPRIKSLKGEQVQEIFQKPFDDKDLIQAVRGAFSGNKKRSSLAGTPPPKESAPSGEEVSLFSKEFLDPEIREVAELYVIDFDERLAEAETLLKKHDQKELKAWVHNLKGVAGNLGLKALHLWAKDMDNLCKGENFYWERAIIGLKEFEILGRKLMKAIKDL